MVDHLVKEPKTKRGKDTLQRICDSAEHIFYEKGYYNTSINEIADRASVAPGTFYIYFNDKLSVYRYILLQFSTAIRKQIKVATQDLTTRFEIEFIGLKTYLEFFKNHKSLDRLIWECQYVDYDLFRNYYESFADGYIKGIKEAQKNKEIKDIDPTTVSYMLMGISSFIGLKYINFDDVDNLDQIIEDVMSILKDGLFINKK
ncbi:TetR/AcrR family transcriptional regulator [Haloplasma contractile]|uniref:Transcriptional regulator AcrR family protein n=1 Tax=Haloplasma contractile SSD-17B TaxID=1033810 RepID=U2EAG3_9MOLU|nr:TetR/AcrR family transcriptional regulator [Haloplasma contractile]ERJ11821.1 Transcriptional regulator AcrR family protein [Haloplasma contractile SSD-17B]